MPDEYVGEPDPEKEVRGNALRAGWEEALAANVTGNLKDGFKMAMNILPTIMSIGLLGLTLAEFTPIYDVKQKNRWPEAR